MHTARHIKLSLALVAGLYAGTAHAQIVVIVSVKNQTVALSNNQAADIFLGRALTFPDGAKVVPIDQAEGSSAREVFYAKTSGKATPQMTAYWSKMIFTGRGQPPLESGDNATVRELVAGNPNTIGYIDKSWLDGSVKVVLTVR